MGWLNSQYPPERYNAQWMRKFIEEVRVAINNLSNENFPNGIDIDSAIECLTAKFGDVEGGNYSEFESDGTIKFNGNATVWDDIIIEPTIRSTGTGVPTFEKWFDNGAGSNGVFLFSFTDEHVNQKEIHFTLQMPHAWKGTAIGIHVHWIPKTSQSSKKVKWGLEYNWSEIGATFGNTTIVYKDINIQGDTSLVQNKHYITAFDAITPSVNQDGISSILIGRLFRNTVDTVNDTYTDKVGLLYIDVHYEMNTLGSRSEYTK